MLGVYLILSLCTTFLSSVLEAVILSVTRTHINFLIKNGHRSGKRLKAMKDHIDRPISAILTLNTIAHTVGAGGVGAEVMKIYGEEWVAIASGVMTFLILVFAEIIPKMIGASQWKRLAPMSSLVIQALIIITYPFVVLSELLGRLVSSKDGYLAKITREEVISAAETGQSDGTLVEKEAHVIRNLLRLQSLFVEDIMTPRKDINALQKDCKVGEIIGRHATLYFSRIPIYGRDLDDVIGMVLRYQILEAASRDVDELTLEKLVLPISFVSPKLAVPVVLDEFLKKQEQVFLVQNEQKHTVGLITFEDVIETLLGVEIIDEFDSVEDMRKFAIGQWESRKKLREFSQTSKKAAG
jgi:CBS domain containing-hemolysin-like protein